MIQLTSKPISLLLICDWQALKSVERRDLDYRLAIIALKTCEMLTFIVFLFVGRKWAQTIKPIYVKMQEYHSLDSD